MYENLPAAIERVIDAKLHDIFTAMPAKIIRVSDDVSLKVDVQPLVQMRYKDEKVFSRAPLLDVPVIMPCTNSSSINIPIQVGDIVLCLFGMRSLTTFKVGDGDEAPPNDFRILDKRDAVAIPGLYPFNIHPNINKTVHNPRDLSITHNIGLPTEASVVLGEDGSASLYKDETNNIKVSSAGVEINGVLMINGVPYLLHGHSGVTVGGGLTGPVAP